MRGSSSLVKIRMISTVLMLCYVLLPNSVKCNNSSHEELLENDRRRCFVRRGLRCGSQERKYGAWKGLYNKVFYIQKFLGEGDSYTISSRICGNGRYPGNENCKWQFTVSKKCLPTIQCAKMDLLGNWRRG